MSDKEKLWTGVNSFARKALVERDYSRADLGQRVASVGVDASELIELDRSKANTQDFWIPGFEIFSRTIYPQRHRGAFGEFVRQSDGVLGKINLWPVQWSTARMFAGSAKGFHIHPPHLPAGTEAAAWFKKLFVEGSENYALRPYDREQWDVMFFVQGIAEVILRDVREGLPRRTLRFFIDGDNHRSANNAGIVVPAGVAHAIRAEGSEDVIMVYGTTTVFQPEFEGRIASDIETSQLPESWRQFLSEK